MSRTYRRVMYGCTGFAIIGGSAYAALTIAAAVEGPGSDLALPLRLNNILLTVIAGTALAAAQAWFTQSANRSSAREIAASVETSVAGHLEARMVKVAEQTSAARGEQLVEAIQRIAEAVGSSVTEDLRGDVGAWLNRAHTGGMIFEANARSRDGANGNVSPIYVRRGE